MFKVSVVIPAKNRALTLPACLDSVLNQTFLAAEVIVVDDASSDNTREIVESYSGRGVRYAKLEHGCGAQAARNLGIKLAQYDWIAFQDSDDLWLPQKLEIQDAALRVHHYDKNWVVHGNGLKRFIETGITEPITPPHSEGDCYKQLLLKASPMFQGMVVSKQALESIGLLDEQCPSYQEWETAIRLAAVCKFIHIQQPLFEWIWHEGETISKDKSREIRGFEYVTEKHKQAILEHHGPRAWRRIKAQNIGRALSYGLWDEAKRMVKSEPWHPVFVLAWILARMKIAPRGMRQVLHWVAYK